MWVNTTSTTIWRSRWVLRWMIIFITATTWNIQCSFAWMPASTSLSSSPLLSTNNSCQLTFSQCTTATTTTIATATATATTTTTTTTTTRMTMNPQEDDQLSHQFDTIVNSRYACTRFLRHSSSSSEPPNTGTTPNPLIVQKATQALAISLRAPSGFNAQPYRAILVSDPHIKAQMAHYCLGRNADRVRDSDCTVVFVADCQCTRDFSKLKSLLLQPNYINTHPKQQQQQQRKKPLTNFMLRKIQLLIALFSSGYPLPRLFSNILSFGIRTGMTLLGVVTRHKLLLPSLATAETWASKNTMLFAMTYILACTSRHLVTCPMEGYQAAGIKRVLGIPQGGRFKIPLIVSTGLPYATTTATTTTNDDAAAADDEDIAAERTKDKKEEEEDPLDDAGMIHGKGGAQNRFDFQDVVFENTFVSS